MNDASMTALRTKLRALQHHCRSFLVPDDQMAGTTDAVDRILANLQAVCREAGGTLGDIVKLNIYVTDKTTYRRQQEAIGQVYRRYFGMYYPAMTLVEVKSLWDDEAMIEIEALAVLARSE